MAILVKKRQKMSEKDMKKYKQLAKNPWVFNHVETIRGRKFRNNNELKEYIAGRHGSGKYLVLEKPEGQGPFRKLFYEELGKGEA